MELNSDFSNMKITYIRTPVVSFTTVQCLMAELQAKTSVFYMSDNTSLLHAADDLIEAKNSAFC